MRTTKTMMYALASAALVLGLGAGGAQAQDEDWDTAGFVENATYYRDGPGISKFRNTVQFEFSKELGERMGLSNFRVSGTLRGTYDAVYDLKDGEFGDNAGGPRQFENYKLMPTTGDGLTDWGNSPLKAQPFYPGFGFNATDRDAPLYNPNDGLKVLGEDFHNPNGGLTLGVPVRPCDEDNRGCDLDGYTDFESADLRFPEFNDRLDFIRELYFEGSVPTGDVSELFFRVGKQQVVWGRTDLFRVLDIINPVDYSRHNIYDELEDIRIPQWIATAEYRWGAVGFFDDLNVQLVWNFDEFRPNVLGNGGTPYSILDAGSFFRAMNTCWTHGCTASNFVPAAAVMVPAGPADADGNPTLVQAFPNDPRLLAADFGPGVIGIRKVDAPDWALDNTQGGLKVEGVLGSVGFSLNYYRFFQQLPTLRGDIVSTNAFNGMMADWPYLVAFDIGFPEVDLFGGSLDMYVDALKTVVRVETAYTTGEEFTNSLEPGLYSDSDVFRWVLGLDRNTFIPFLNKNRAFLISGQIFGQHLLDHVEETRPGGPTGEAPGKVGMPDWEDNYILTLLVKGWYKSDTISPQVILAWDTEAEAGTFAPSVDWLINDDWRLVAGFNIKFGNGMKDHEFDDCRSCNPFHPFTAGPSQTEPGSGGWSGVEPLGRFRAGPLGSASEEDEFQVTLRYRF